MWGTNISPVPRTIDLYPVSCKHQRCVTCMRKPTCLHASVSFFTPIFSLLFFERKGDFGHCVCLTYSCSLSFFIYFYYYYYYSYSSQYGRPTAKSILIYWLVLKSRSTTELIQAAMMNKTLVVTCKLPFLSFPGDLLVLSPLLIFLNSCIFTVPCPLSEYEPSSLAPSFTGRIKWRRRDSHDLCFHILPIQIQYFFYI